MKSHFILYVRDQQASTLFYETVLAISPSLNVPGMTEFQLGENTVLGLMPEAGIVRLLGSAIANPSRASGIPRVELYLVVEDAQAYLTRAMHAGAKELSGLSLRNWGHTAGYCADPDGHVVAFAQE